MSTTREVEEQLSEMALGDEVVAATQFVPEDVSSSDEDDEEDDDQQAKPATAPTKVTTTPPDKDVQPVAAAGAATTATAAAAVSSSTTKENQTKLGQSRALQSNKSAEAQPETDRSSAFARPSDPLPQNLEQLPEVMPLLKSKDPEDVYRAVFYLRKLLVVEPNPPIDRVITTGCVPVLVALLARPDASPRLQFEIIWVLTNISSGTSEHTRVVVESGAIPLLVRLCGSKSEDVCEQAVWALGNVAGDNVYARDYVTHCGGLQAIVAVASKSHARMTMTRTSAWALSNLCRGKPAPPLDAVTSVVPLAVRLLHVNDAEVKRDALWTLRYLSESAEFAASLIRQGLVPVILQLLVHPSMAVQTLALRIVGNLVMGDDATTQVVLNAGVLPVLAQVLKSRKHIIRKEALWTLSNITAGSQQQVDAVVKANLIPSVIMSMNHYHGEIAREATWVVCNALSISTPERVQYFVQQGVVPALAEQLRFRGVRHILLGLETLDHVLRAGHRRAQEKGVQKNPYVDLVEQSALHKLEELQNHFNDDICRKANEILSTYFDDEDGMDEATFE